MNVIAHKKISKKYFSMIVVVVLLPIAEISLSLCVCQLLFMCPFQSVSYHCYYVIIILGVIRTQIQNVRYNIVDLKDSD